VLVHAVFVYTFRIFPPEIRQSAQGPVGAPPTRHIDHVADEVVEGVPIRTYQGSGLPTGLVVYFHGGAFTVGIKVGSTRDYCCAQTHFGAAIIERGRSTDGPT